mgnify:CR=1 FL=1
MYKEKNNFGQLGGSSRTSSSRFPGINTKWSKEVLYIEHYCFYDLDDDGIAERVRVCTIGNGVNIINCEACLVFKLYLHIFNIFIKSTMFDSICYYPFLNV